MGVTVDEATLPDRQHQLARIARVGGNRSSFRARSTVSQACIARGQEETSRFATEQHKLATGAAMLLEDRFVAPLLILDSLGSGLVVAVPAHPRRRVRPAAPE